MVATVLDEAPSIPRLLRSLYGQTAQPDEIVVVDGGSTDGTVEYLTGEAVERSALRVLVRPGAGRSSGRNLAIESTSADVIACIDAGCVAEPRWLEHLLRPFTAGACWVAGFYRPEGSTTRATCIGLTMVYVLEEVDPESFLPSTRSMAFRREVWGRVGGFPEGTDYAEDTWFDERALAEGFDPVFVPEAVVVWQPPETYRQLWRTMYRWGRGDGRAGLRSTTYRRLLLLLTASGVAAATTAFVAPAFIPLALSPLLASVLSRSRHKYRWSSGVGRFVHIPLAQLIHTVATTAGFIHGRFDRGRGGPISEPTRA